MKTLNIVRLTFVSGEVLGFENLVYSVFEFIHALIDINKFRGTIRKTMTDLLYYVVLYMQMTEDQVEFYSSGFMSNVWSM